MLVGRSWLGKVSGGVKRLCIIHLPVLGDVNDWAGTLKSTSIYTLSNLPPLPSLDLSAWAG